MINLFGRMPSGLAPELFKFGYPCERSREIAIVIFSPSRAELVHVRHLRKRPSEMKSRKDRIAGCRSLVAGTNSGLGLAPRAPEENLKALPIRYSTALFSHIFNGLFDDPSMAPFTRTFIGAL